MTLDEGIDLSQPHVRTLGHGYKGLVWEYRCQLIHAVIESVNLIMTMFC